MEKKYLTEENYEKGKRTLTFLAIGILLVGLLVGGGLIYTGLMKQKGVNSEYSEENKEKVSQQLEKEKQNLLKKKSELEKKGIKYDVTTTYSDGEAYDLLIITEVLDPGFDYCTFDEYQENELTSKYCSLENKLEDISDDFNKSFDSHGSIPFYMFGAFAIIVSFMTAGFVFFISKGREIAAFTTQQVMPVAQEGIDAMAPTVGNAAKEIARGIKEGLSDEEKK